MEDNAFKGCSVQSLSAGANIKDKNYQRKSLMTYMFARTQRMFSYSGLPDSIKQRDIEKNLQQFGHVTIFKLNDGRIVCDAGGFTGLPDGYYLPREVIVINPYFFGADEQQSRKFTIGEDCVVIKNDSYYYGLTPMFSKYAELLATNEISIYVADILARIQAIILAGDANARKQAEIYLNKIMKGDLAFFASNAFKENVQTSPFADAGTQILTSLTELEQYLKASWLNEIGLNANWNAKRESLNSNESQLNGDFLLPLVDDMFECRKEGIEELNKMFDLNVSIQKGSSWEDIENRETIESELDKTGPEDQIEEEGGKEENENN